MYKHIIVWKRVSEVKAIRYVCFEDIVGSKFCVQSADFFYLPLDRIEAKWLDEQISELLIELDPGQRSGWFGSLVEAIAHHDKDFSN